MKRLLTSYVKEDDWNGRMEPLVPVIIENNLFFFLPPYLYNGQANILPFDIT